MPDYALLTLPSANRVYGRDLARLALAELAVVAPVLHGQLNHSAEKVVGGVEYLLLDAEELDDHDVFLLSNLSATYALFRVGADGSFLPLPVGRLEYFGSDLITIQRYSGKTNEQFTHLMVNVAVALSAAARERSRQGLPVRLLDPVAGRGTSLNRGLMYGFDVAGIDLDGSDFEAYRLFLTTYLKDNRLSPKLEEAHIRKGPLTGARRFSLRIRRTQSVEVVRDDTTNTSEHFGARSFDVLVGDLPYGVHHGSTATGGLSRAPGELVVSALPGWRRVMRSGAGLALAWNTKTFARDEFEDALRHAGFTVVDNASSFDHRVDRSITRGLVLATA
jgi:hypothetical protein